MGPYVHLSVYPPSHSSYRAQGQPDLIRSLDGGGGGKIIIIYFFKHRYSEPHRVREARLAGISGQSCCSPGVASSPLPGLRQLVQTG
jgi:hypothetical protein